MDGYALGDCRLSPTVRRGLNRCAGCGLALAILLMAAASWAATYRWVDDKGRVHYGDSIPPQYADQGHSELSEEGRVVKRVEGASGAAAVRERREREARQHEADEREARARQRRDNALLATYAGVAEIDRARERALAQEQSLLDSLQAMRKHSESKAESAYIDAMIGQRHKTLAEIRARFDADKARYLELTGGR